MKSRLFNLRNIFFTIGAIFLITLYALLLMQLMADKSVLKQVDYIAFYTGGYIARYESLSQLYDLDLQHRVQAAVTAPILLARFYPYNHPPLLARVLQWVTTSNYNASFFRWSIVMLIFHLTSLGVLISLMRSMGWQRGEVWIIGISSLLFYPIFTAYLKGQDSTFLLLGVTLWTFGLVTDKDQVAGLGLALATIRPQLALVLALPFLFKRRRVWWWFVGWGIVLFIYSYLLIGLQGLKEFVQQLLFSVQGIDVDKMPTLMGAVVRAFPAISPSLLKIIGYSGYAFTILFLCWLWFKSRTIEFRHVGLAVLLCMAFSPHLHNHDLSLLLIPALGVASVLVKHRLLSRQYAALLPLGFSLLLAFNGILQTKLTFYMVMLVLGLLLWVPEWLKANRKEPMVC